MRLVQGLESHLTPECLGKDLVSLSLSPLHLLAGHSSGYVTLLRRLNSFCLEKKISRRVTSKNNLTLVSLGPGLACVGCKTGEVILLQLSPVTIRVFTIRESVTALSVCPDSGIYVGGERGCVAVYSSHTGDTRQVLDLAARVVQVEVSGETVVTSSTAATVICNTRQKTFRQVGSHQKSGHQHGISITGGQVWTSRAGARVWQVDINTGEVLATVKYKQLLDSLQPSDIIGSDLTHSNTSPGEHSFSYIKTNSSGLSVTFSISGYNLYILDLEQSKVIAWTTFSQIKIKEAHIDGDLVLVVGTEGEVVSLRFGDILSLSRHCLTLGRDDLLRQLLLSVYQDPGGVTEYSRVQLSKLYFLCLRLTPSLSQIESHIMKILGGSTDSLSRSAPTLNSLPVTEDRIRNHTRRHSDTALPSSVNHESGNSFDIGDNKNETPDYYQVDEIYLKDFPFDVLSTAYHEETLFGADIYGQSLVQEFGRIFLRNSGDEESSKTLKEDYTKALLLLCADICEEGAVSEEKISQLAGCFYDLITEKCEAKHLDLTGVLAELSPEERSAENLTEAARKIFSCHQYRSTFFQPPLTDLLVESLPFDFLPHYACTQLVMMFDQEVTDLDKAVASFLLLLSPLSDGKTILAQLDVSSYYSIHVLLTLDQERKPTVAPIPLEQITEENVYENVNILSKCSGLSILDILRYFLHISIIDTACALHFLQNFVLELPLSCVFYLCLAHYDALRTSISDRVFDSVELTEAVQSDFMSMMARTAASHIPAWSESWTQALKSHPRLVGHLTEALKVTNERQLSKVANIVGADKAPDCLELLSLAEFLADHLMLSPIEAADFFQRSYSFAGLARLASQHSEVALTYLPILIELGDVDLLSDCGLLADHPEEVVGHLARVYPGGRDLPLDLLQLANSLLSQLTGGQTYELILALATKGVLSRGTLDQRFYSRLILKRLEERSND